MRVKVGNQKTARYILFGNHCQACAFYTKSLDFCVSMNCSIDGLFVQTGISEDIFKL